MILGGPRILPRRHRRTSGTRTGEMRPRSIQEDTLGHHRAGRLSTCVPGRHGVRSRDRGRDGSLPGRKKQSIAGRLRRRPAQQISPVGGIPSLLTGLRARPDPNRRPISTGLSRPEWAAPARRGRSLVAAFVGANRVLAVFDSGVVHRRGPSHGTGGRASLRPPPGRREKRTGPSARPMGQRQPAPLAPRSAASSRALLPMPGAARPLPVVRHAPRGRTGLARLPRPPRYHPPNRMPAAPPCSNA